MATVYIQKRIGRRGMTTYPVFYRDPVRGKNFYYKTFRRHKDAQQSANDLRALLDAGKVPEEKARQRRISPLTFEEVSRSLTDVWKDRQDRGELSKATYYRYEKRLSILIRDLGPRILCQMTRPEIVEYRNKVAKETSKVNSNRGLFLIKQVFKHGIELNAIKADPVEDIQYLSEREHERNRFLLPHQLDKLIEACNQVRSKSCIPAIICLGAEHGASKQEILDLKWADIDFEFEGKGLIRFFRTKNRSERTEYLMPRTREALLNWREHQRWMRHRKKVEDKGLGYVFCRLDGRQLASFTTSWERVRAIAGFPDLHFHDLRHTFCSNLILSGADLKDVKEMIGHRDIQMTDRYSHLTTLRKLSKQADLARFYANGEGSKK